MEALDRNQPSKEYNEVSSGNQTVFWVIIVLEKTHSAKSPEILMILNNNFISIGRDEAEAFKVESTMKSALCGSGAVK